MWWVVPSVLFLLCLIGLTLIFYIIGLRQGVKRVKSLEEEIKEKLNGLTWRYEREMRALTREVRHLSNGMAMIATAETFPWSPLLENEETPE